MNKKSRSYLSVKKHRYLKKFVESVDVNPDNQLDCSNWVEESSVLEEYQGDVDVGNADGRVNEDSNSLEIRDVSDMEINELPYDGDGMENINCNNELPEEIVRTDQLPEERHVELQVLPNLTSKLRNWALKHINVLTNSATSELLTLLRSEGHTDLPKTAVTLLGTKSCVEGTVLSIPTHRGANGDFVYFGIEKGLRGRISPESFLEDDIELLFNIDGLPVFKSSSTEFWPILCMVYNKKYCCKPFVVALYCGDSKPADINDFLNDFVNELILLIENGITIEDKLFTVTVKAFVCDTPARSFLKCTKGHVGFFACERCEIRGQTVNSRRIYGESDCLLRTDESFRLKRQPEHHLGISPLERVPGLGLVSVFLLDWMHLGSGVMKNLLLKWVHGGNKSRLDLRSIQVISKRLEALRPHVPVEFQRKPRSLKELKRWKSTEFRFFLLYAGPILLKDVLPSRRYKHFLLLHTAARILCHPEEVCRKIDFARMLLVKFFLLLPHIYGRDSQIMNFHNLIHICDDAEKMQAPLDDYTAFPFENYLGKIKKLIRTPNKPFAQVCRRLSELQSEHIGSIELQPVTNISPSDVIPGSVANCEMKYKKMRLKNMTLTTQPPNNLVILRDGTLLEINNIVEMIGMDDNLNRMFIEGHERHVEARHLFKYPCISSKLGFLKLGYRSERISRFPCTTVLRKMVRLKVKTNTEYATTMLHE